MNPLFTHLPPLSPESKQAMENILQTFEYKKHEIILKEDSTCHYLYFVASGATRTFYYKDGKDITDWISMENTFACSIVSFITRKPDIRGIEALEASTLYALPYEGLEQLYKQYHEIEHIGRVITSQGLVQMQQRFDDLHFKTAAQRYENLIRETPDIVLRFPLGIIASYLGITQETLSRIRRF